ncbi:hypothetical protein, partial [Klebsiella pneumoniae]|uniref:hypothetical protein n=1 Tax=Klebsiella pneumoniae TaxID=573 RepID=UPI00272F4C62
IMHLFSTRTSYGILYEVDSRLRPSGDAGMMVTTADAVADYQQNEAWTWEQQALVAMGALDRSAYAKGAVTGVHTVIRLA